MHERRARPIPGLLLAGLLMAGSSFGGGLDFDADRAFGQLKNYMSFSPVTPGSDNSKLFSLHARSELEAAGYSVYIDEWTEPASPVPMRNILAVRGDGPKIRLVAAHYDARIWADKDEDPSRHRQPVPAANDGGSGVAVLLELARSVQPPEDSTLWLALLDAEDQGGIPGWGGPHAGWILGSQRMASRLTGEQVGQISEMILLDIVGSPGLRLTPEGQSDPELARRVWEIAGKLGYQETFLPGGTGGPILDDHIPFLERGVRVLDLIQQEGDGGSAFFPWHHTTGDTLDRVSRESLGRVGRTVEAYLEEPAPHFVQPPDSGMGWRWAGYGGGALAAGLAARRWLRRS